MTERHLLEQAKRGAEAFVDWRGRVVVEDLLDQRVVTEGGRRDRGVSVGSKMTLVQAGDERRKQFALADGPF